MPEEFIPTEVLEAASLVAKDIGAEDSLPIARAIMAERRRCAKIAQWFRERDFSVGGHATNHDIAVAILQGVKLTDVGERSAS